MSGRDPGAAEGKGRASAQGRAQSGASATTPAQQGAPKILLPALTLSAAANKQANKQTGVGRAEEYTEPVCSCNQSPTVGSRDLHNHCHVFPAGALADPTRGSGEETWRGLGGSEGQCKFTWAHTASHGLQPIPVPGRNMHKNGACVARLPGAGRGPRRNRDPHTAR